MERGIIFLPYCYPERITYDDACHLKKCCVNPVRKEVTAVSKGLRKMDMVGDKYISGNMWIDDAKPIATTTIEINCMEQVSVCPSVYRCRFTLREGGWERGGGIKTYDCKGNRTNGGNNRSMWWP